MGAKKSDNRFTIQFNAENPAHARAAGILNSRGKRGKAQYVASAILHYESCPDAHEAETPQAFDEKAMGEIVNRVLLILADGAANPPAAVPASRQGPAGGMASGNSPEGIGEGGRDAVDGAMKMFRGAP